MTVSLTGGNLNYSNISFASEVSILTVYVGEVVDVTSLNESDAMTTWKSSNDSVLEYDGSHSFRGIKPGTVLVTAHNEDLTESVNYIITVKGLVNGLDIKQADITMNLGDTMSLDYDIKTSAQAKVDFIEAVRWISNDKSTASVDVYGNVIAHNTGAVKITGYTKDGNYKDSVNVIIKSDYEGVSFLETTNEITLSVGESRQLNLYRKPSDDLVDNAIWNSINGSIVSVEKGLVKGESVGATNVFAYDPLSGEKKSIRVRVISRAKGFVISETKVVLSENKPTYNLNYEILQRYENLSVIDNTIIWKSSNVNVATVNTSGLVTAIGSGSTRITGTTKDGNYHDVCSVQVEISVPNKNVKSTSLEGASIGDMPYLLVVGEKVPVVIHTDKLIDYKELKVFISEGSSSQVTLEDDGVYVIPNIVGKNELSLKDGAGNQLTWSFRSRTYLNRIEIDVNSLPPKRDGVPTVFIGQRWALDYILQPVRGHEVSEIIQKGATWESSNDNIAYFEGDQLVALKEGEIEVTVTSNDTERTDVVELQIRPMVARINVKSPVNLQVGDVYKPEIEYVLAGDYTEPFIKDLNYRLINSFILSTYLESEKKYEMKLINALEESGIGGLTVEVNRHKARLNQVEEMLEYQSGVYSPLVGGFKDRSGNMYSIVEINENDLEIVNQGKVLLEITTVDNLKSDTVTLVID